MLGCGCSWSQLKPLEGGESMDRAIMESLFPEQTRLAEQGYCPMCAVSMAGKSFKDALSFREFQISGMCQVCQDEVFNQEGGE